ncbi:hypothetical protein DXG01_007522 [Tephrocybe rancida]|nr:hypothetical protein DXG01_007522 [Tephrocybe rancida]
MTQKQTTGSPIPITPDMIVAALQELGLTLARNFGGKAFSGTLYRPKLTYSDGTFETGNNASPAIAGSASTAPAPSPVEDQGATPAPVGVVDGETPSAVVEENEVTSSPCVGGQPGGLECCPHVCTACQVRELAAYVSAAATSAATVNAATQTANAAVADPAIATTVPDSGAAGTVDQADDPSAVTPAPSTTATALVATLPAPAPNTILANQDGWYVVTIGREVGVFQGWSRVQPLVNGVSGFGMRRCASHTAALEAFEEAMAQGLVEIRY